MDILFAGLKHETLYIMRAVVTVMIALGIFSSLAILVIERDIFLSFSLGVASLLLSTIRLEMTSILHGNHLALHPLSHQK